MARRYELRAICMKDYLAWKKSTTKNPDTPINYERWVKRFLAFLDGKPITLENFGRFKAHLEEVGYSEKNIQYGSYLIRDYIAYQVTVHELSFPLSLLRIPQARSSSHHALMPDEYERLVAELPKGDPVAIQRRLMLMLMWDTGMRVGELTRLKIADLEIQRAVIENEKNHRSRRIGWSKETEKLLKRYLRHRKKVHTKEPYLFVSLKWKPAQKISTRHVERIVFDLRRKADIRTLVRPHSFRHGFVHRKLAEGKPMTTIAQMLGHSTAMNVMNYAQLNSKEMQEAWVM